MILPPGTFVHLQDSSAQERATLESQGREDKHRVALLATKMRWSHSKEQINPSLNCRSQAQSTIWRPHNGSCPPCKSKASYVVGEHSAHEQQNRWILASTLSVVDENFLASLRRWMNDPMSRCIFMNSKSNILRPPQSSKIPSPPLSSTRTFSARPSPVWVRPPSSSSQPSTPWSQSRGNAQSSSCATLESWHTRSRTSTPDSASTSPRSRPPSSTVVRLWPRISSS